MQHCRSAAGWVRDALGLDRFLLGKPCGNVAGDGGLYGRGCEARRAAGCLTGGPPLDGFGRSGASPSTSTPLQQAGSSWDLRGGPPVRAADWHPMRKVRPPDQPESRARSAHTQGFMRHGGRAPVVAPCFPPTTVARIQAPRVPRVETAVVTYVMIAVH